MLVLTRKKGQSIVINGEIEIVIASVEGDQVKIGISAPESYKIYRKEIIEMVQQSNQEAVVQSKSLHNLGNILKTRDIKS